MSWHTLQTQTNTLCASWPYQVHLVLPLELVLNYEVNIRYILKTCFQKPKHPD